MATNEGFYQKVVLQKEQSLIFAKPHMIEFPIPTQTKRNFLTSLKSIIMQPIKTNHKKCFVAIPNQFFIMGKGNVIRMYRYWQDAEENLQCEINCELKLEYNIKQVKVSRVVKTMKDKGFYIIVQDFSSNYLEVLHYQSNSSTIRKVKMHKIPSTIYCWSFIENHELLLWCHNMRAYHYQIKWNGLSPIYNFDTGINLKQELEPKQQRWSSADQRKPRSVTPTKQTVNKINKENVFVLHYCCILGYRGKQQDSIIVLFYVLYNQQMNGMKIKCKEILYPYQNDQPQSGYGILKCKYSEFAKLKPMPETHQIISSNTASPEILKTLSIVQIEDAFLARFQFEIIVIQKKFQKYFALDNVYKKTKQCAITMSYNSNLVACIFNSILQFNQIQIGENKVNSSLIDFIELQTQYEQIKDQLNRNYDKKDHQNIHKLKQLIKNNKRPESSPNKKNGQQQTQNEQIKLNNDPGLYSLWVTSQLMTDQNRTNLCLVFEIKRKQNGQQKQYYQLIMTKHMSRIKKLTRLAHKTKQISEIQKIQKLGESLGVNQSQFYFYMWRTSAKQDLQQILLYLLKCRDYKRILQQIKGYLRKRAQVVTKLIRVLQKLQSLTLQIAKEKINEENLINYFHVIFVHRKLQIYQMDYRIDEYQFSEALQISVYDLVKKVIDQQFYPETQKVSVWMTQPKQLPKLNIIQILDLFKLSLIEQYDVFLRVILQMYPDRIIDIIENFPEFLPVYPFAKYQIIKKNAVNAPPLPPQSMSKRQSQFFSNIKQEDMRAEPCFLQNTLRHLYAYYPTSLILKFFDSSMKNHDMKDKKFKFHSMIQLPFQEYYEKINALPSIGLYIVVLQCLVIAANAKQEKCQIEQLCQIFRKSYNIEDKVLEKLQIAASLYQLMIDFTIIEQDQVSLQTVYDEPIQKWIALFFLGNKQQKDLIFTDYMQIYRDPQAFVEAMRKFVASQHCSKIQLSFLIDLITHKGEDFQRENQNIINVIIDGFCSRVQISDTPDSNHFMERVRTIQLEPQLLMKVDKIEKMKLCKRIFSIFYMEDILVKDLMDKTVQILQRMLQSFFNRQIKQSKLAISQKKCLDIQIKQVSNMFELLNFLRENVLFNVSSERLAITYCKKLIEWQSFEEVQHLLYQSDYLDNQGLSRDNLIQTIQAQIMQIIYKDENAQYDQITVDYINKILSLERRAQKNPIVIQERAKIALAQMFKNWEKQKKLIQINEMCTQWEQAEQEVNRNNQYGEVLSRAIMVKIINQNVNYLNVTQLQQIYKYFMIATTCNQEFDTKTDEFYHYCTRLGSNLMDLPQPKLKQTSEIICIANQRFEMNYWLMAECLLRSIIQIYPISAHIVANQSPVHVNQNYDKAPQSSSDKQKVSKKDKSRQKQNTLQKDKDDDDSYRLQRRFSLFKNSGILATPILPNQQELEESSLSSQWVKEEADSLTIIKRYIDYFVVYWKQRDQDAMRRIFSCFFGQTLEQDQQIDIEIDHSLCFKLHHQKIATMYLWTIVQKICKQIAQQKQQNINWFNTFYAYFFLHMGLVEPKVGFANIGYISYNQFELVNVLIKFKDVCESNSTFNFLDYSVIFKIYLDALTQLLTLNHQQDLDFKDMSLSRDKIQTNSIRKTNQDSDLMIRGKPNLEVVRQMVKKGLYKGDPLSALVNKMSSITQQAFKNAKKRECQYNVGQRKLELQLNNKSRVMKKKQKQQKKKQEEEKKEQQRIQNEKIAMMSFDQFKKMKNKIKNDKTLSMTLGPDLDITQRVIIQQIFNKMECENKSIKLLGGKRNEIPQLTQLILTSLREIDAQQKQHKGIQEGMKEAANHQSRIIKQDLFKSMKKEHCSQDQILVNAITTQNYSSISSWSTDAILIQTAKVFDCQQIKLSMVIKMFHELCVGNNNKVDVMFISEFDESKINNQTMKKIFNIDFLKSDFGSYSDFQQQILFDRVLYVIDSMPPPEIKCLAAYLKQICKIQYKKAMKNNWTNMFGIIAVNKVAESTASLQQKIKRLDSLIELFSSEYIEGEFENILKIFDNDKGKQILAYLDKKLRQTYTKLSN